MKIRSWYVIALALTVVSMGFAVRDAAATAPESAGFCPVTAEQALEAAPELPAVETPAVLEPDGYPSEGVTELTVQEESWVTKIRRFKEQQDRLAPANQSPPKKKSFGRWVKKHWYVPVIAAVAIGVALADDDDSVDDDD